MEYAIFALVIFLILQNSIKTQKIMAKFDEIKAEITAIKDSTANIAADIDRIAASMEGGLTSEQADSVIAELKASSTALKAVADRNPEPPTEPTEPTEGE